MYKYIFVIVTSSLFFSCTNKYRDAADLIGKNWHAKKCEAEVVDSDNDKKSIVLVIENLKDVKKDYPQKNITSMAALAFIENLSYEDYSDCNNIKVILKNGATPFEKTYTISQLMVAKDILNKVNIIGQKIISGNLDQLEKHFDKTIFADSTMAKIKKSILSSDSIYGKQINCTITSFDFKPLPNTTDTIFLTHFETSNPKGYFDYKVVIRPIDRQIIYFGMNDK